MRHATLRLRPSARLADPRVAITAALRRLVRHMRGPTGPDHPYVHTGLAGTDVLADVWPALPEMAGDRLGETLAGLRFRIRHSGTGGALYRSLQARFEHDAAALLGAPQLGRAALVCDDLSDAWRALAGATEAEDALVAHTVAWPWVQRIRVLERSHVEALERQLDGRS